jgi:hypothetical protein
MFKVGKLIIELFDQKFHPTHPCIAAPPGKQIGAVGRRLLPAIEQRLVPNLCIEIIGNTVLKAVRRSLFIEVAASTVTSRPVSPVPPVVKITSMSGSRTTAAGQQSVAFVACAFAIRKGDLAVRQAIHQRLAGSVISQARIVDAQDRDANRNKCAAFWVKWSHRSLQAGLRDNRSPSRRVLPG